jgi:hypothetical protein
VTSLKAKEQQLRVLRAKNGHAAGSGERKKSGKKKGEEKKK